MIKLLFLLIAVLLFAQVNLFSQTFNQDCPLAHTFSIVAYDSATGRYGSCSSITLVFRGNNCNLG